MAARRLPARTLAVTLAAVILTGCAKAASPVEEAQIPADDGGVSIGPTAADWSCLASLTSQWERPRSIALGLRATGGVQYEGTTAKVCAASDVGCVRPLHVVTLSPDRTEAVRVASGWYGWEGRVEVTGNGLVPILFSRVPAPVADDTWIVPPNPLFAFPLQLAAATGIYPDPGRGMIGFQAHDCKGIPAAGVSATVFGYAHEPSLYVANGSPRSTATSTGEEGSGLGLIVDIPRGLARLVAVVEATGEEIAVAHVMVRPGALSVVVLHPSVERQPSIPSP